MSRDQLLSEEAISMISKCRCGRYLHFDEDQRARMCIICRWVVQVLVELLVPGCVSSRRRP